MGWTNVLVSSLILVGVGVLFTTKPFSNHAEKLVDKMQQVITQLSGSTQPQGRSGATKSGERLFTKEEIEDYDGKTRSDIYIALVGSVYDVTKGARFYAAGNHYGGFSGKHADSCNDLSALYCFVKFYRLYRVLTVATQYELQTLENSDQNMRIIFPAMECDKFVSEKNKMTKQKNAPIFKSFKFLKSLTEHFLLPSVV